MTNTKNAPAKLPFRYGTVRRRINIGSYPVTLGQSIPSIVIPQVGMMARILGSLTGTYTGANAPLVVKYLDGFDAFINRFRVGLNNGSANIVDVSGIGLNAVNNSLSKGKLPTKAGMGLAVGAQTFTYNFAVPINANDRKQFEIGLINLQAPELRATIDVSFNQAGTIFTTPANFTLPVFNLNLSYEYFEIPDPSVYQMPPLTLVRTIEDAPNVIAATGDQIYQIPRLGTMFDYTETLLLNGLYAPVLDNLTEWRLRYNKSDVQYDVQMPDWETYEALMYQGSAYPGSATGLLFDNALNFNLWSASDRPWNGGDFRDAIDTEENTTTEAITTVAATAVLGANTNAIVHTRRLVQRIVQSPAPTHQGA